MISLKEIGALCGVSESTVSKALKGHPAVSAKTKEKIRQIAKEHHYAPNANVQGIQSGRSQCIGVAINNFGDAYSGRILTAAQEILHDKGYDFIVIPWDLMVHRHEGLFERFACRRTDGVLLFPAAEIPAEPVRAQLRGLGAPVVQIDQTWAGESFGYVGSDNRGGGQEAVRTLLKYGCRRIGIAGMSSISSGSERLAGALEELRSRGIELEPELSLDLSSSREKEESIYRCLLEYFSRRPHPDGLFCFNDRIAALAMKAAAHSGLRVPQEVRVIGFGDLPLSHLTTPSLTTFDQQPEQIGHAAGNMLAECIGAKNGKPLQHIEIPVKLVVRDSLSSWVQEA